MPDHQQQKRQPLIRKPSANSRTLQPQHRQRMIASPEKVSAANARPAVHDNANKGRKRSAEKQPANGIGADHDEVFARAPPKRSLLRRSSERESRVEESSKVFQQIYYLNHKIFRNCSPALRRTQPLSTQVVATMGKKTTSRPRTPWPRPTDKARRDKPELLVLGAQCHWSP